MSIISAQNIQKSFGDGGLITHVLKGIDLGVDEGEFVAIMGKSGAGKSTLLYQLSALDQPDTGTIIIDGQNILTLTQAELVSFRLYTLGYIFQDYALVPDLNALENVILPLLMRGLDWGEADTIAKRALDEVGLVGRYTSLPAQLSGGEQQRVSIARAIAGKPKILFADEPTANLDSISGRAIIALLDKLNREGQTIIMVTHEDEYAQNCDRIIHLEDGRVVSEKKQEVRNTPAAIPYVNPVYSALGERKQTDSTNTNSDPKPQGQAK